MDWYAWLCRAGLHPDVAFEYARLFARNELAADDLRHLDHGLLATMGVPIAKHRLEILKLAKKDSSSAADAGGGDSSSSSYAQLIARKAGRCIARCARRLARPRGVGGGRGSSVTVVPRICSGDDAVRVGAVQAAATRRRRSVKKMVLMITDGGATAARGGVGFAAGRFSGSQKASLMFHDCYEEEDDDYDHEEEARCGDGAEGGDEDAEEERCSDGGGGGGTDVEIKWDSMFQDLKPT